MKRLTVLLVIISVAIFYYLRVGKIPATNKLLTSEQKAQEVQSPIPINDDLPARLVIAKVGIDTTIEAVGMEDDGRMGVPTSAYTVGWWKLGVKPGEVGSAVLAGHYDTPHGTAGVFYDLKKLQKGDEIEIMSTKSVKKLFAVTAINTYSDSAFPINTVFAKNDGKYLNLITCAGTWDKGTKNYQDRLVVFAKEIN